MLSLPKQQAKKSERTPTPQFKQLMNTIIGYCKDKGLEIDDLIDQLDPENLGNLDKQVFIERASEQGLVLEEKDLDHFAVCLGQFDNRYVDTNKLYDELNRRFYDEMSSKIKTAYF